MGQWEWPPAKAVLAELETAGSWNGQVTIPEPYRNPPGHTARSQ
jgi:hypothetical protein